MADDFSPLDVLEQAAPGPRPRRRTQAKMEQAVELARTGLRAPEIAKIMDTNKSTVSVWLWRAGFRFRLSREKKLELRRLYLAGWPVKDLMQRYDLSEGALRAHLQRMDVHREASHRINGEQAATILRLLDEGLSSTEVAAATGVSAPTVRKVFERERGDYTAHYRDKLAARDERIVEMYQAGKLTKQIQYETGAATHTIYRALRKAGVELRQPGSGRR